MLDEQQTSGPATVSVTRRQLADAVGSAGVAPGDTLFVHSSLSSLGHMVGGAPAAVEALLDAVTPTGTVAVPTHSSNLADRLAENGPYDPAASRSRMGAITEALRTRPDAHRSAHPTHSVAAVGPRAGWLVEGHEPTGDTLSLAGPHGRLVRSNAVILFLGVTLSSNTTFHAAESWLGYPWMPDRDVAILGPDGQPRIVTTHFSPSGHRNFYRNQTMGVQPPIDRLFERGLVREVKLNDTPLRAVRARDVIREVCLMEVEAPGAVLCRDPACDFCVSAMHKSTAQRAQIVARARELLARPELCDPQADPVYED
ncbi:MAG: hypothetical protein BIFFINMI_02079 [Phycisphaerae bacterium]|nr:hypothetical protein [Phycisphaerae bacterium]